MLMPWGTLSSSVPTPPSCAWFLHVSALAGLTVLSFIAFEKIRQRIGAVIFIFFYSAFLEFLQYFNPARHATIEDLGANALGCLVGLVFWFAASRIYSVVSEIRQETVTGPIKSEEHVK
jgi:VanZ family protein